MILVCVTDGLGSSFVVFFVSLSSWALSAYFESKPQHINISGSLSVHIHDLQATPRVSSSVFTELGLRASH